MQGRHAATTSHMSHFSGYCPLFMASSPMFQTEFPVIVSNTTSPSLCSPFRLPLGNSLHQNPPTTPLQCLGQHGNFILWEYRAETSPRMLPASSLDESGWGRSPVHLLQFCPVQQNDSANLFRPYFRLMINLRLFSFGFDTRGRLRWPRLITFRHHTKVVR